MCLCAHALLVVLGNVPLNVYQVAVPCSSGHRLLSEEVRVRGRAAKDNLACVLSVCFAEVLLYRLYLLVCLCLFTCLV